MSRKKNETLDRFEPYRKIIFEYLDMNIIDVVPNIKKPSDKRVIYLSRYKGW